jgi:hypothetical protein
MGIAETVRRFGRRLTGGRSRRAERGTKRPDRPSQSPSRHESIPGDTGQDAASAPNPQRAREIVD